MSSRLRIIVSGLIAQHPTLPGVTWDYVQYVLGLAELGHEVFYIEDSGEWPYLLTGGEDRLDWPAPDCAANVHHLGSVMERFGFAERWAYRFPRTGEWFGMSDRRRSSIISSADLVLNVSGTIARPSKYHAARRLAYIDSDPVFTQIRLVLGDRKFRVRVLVHDVHFSFGESLSRHIPKTGQHWKPTRQPIVLSQWRPNKEFRPVFTTIMNWASYRPLDYSGRRYGQKDVQFLHYLDLPRYVPAATLEIALGNLHHAEWQSPDAVSTAGQSVNAVLLRAGWRIVNPAEICPDLDAYRDYIEGSLAEWSVAKHGYVVGQPGWFSCRSACYLAAGRPVAIENTGIDRVLPVGEGILPFNTVTQAAAAVEEVRTNYKRHAAAARDIAETFFDARKVLTHLVERSMDKPTLSAHAGVA
jgi:hypothetical protein